MFAGMFTRRVHVLWGDVIACHDSSRGCFAFTNFGNRPWTRIMQGCLALAKDLVGGKRCCHIHPCLFYHPCRCLWSLWRFQDLGRGGCPGLLFSTQHHSGGGGGSSLPSASLGGGGGGVLPPLSITRGGGGGSSLPWTPTPRSPKVIGPKFSPGLRPIKNLLWHLWCWQVYTKIFFRRVRHLEKLSTTGGGGGGCGWGAGPTHLPPPPPLGPPLPPRPLRGTLDVRYNKCIWGLGIEVVCGMS